MERERLYARIDARVDAMLAAGAEDEVRRADEALAWVGGGRGSWRGVSAVWVG